MKESEGKPALLDARRRRENSNQEYVHHRREMPLPERY